ncbi:hypothetical protein QAD02_009790 [Eretmocerus hayati]|uniref:Uncharacterized protein n=1 Tax=Eretmocerus hayati TaxID=131215 RepID=A0ACC2NCR0_9HYME|nr:hypothetical protein QAD02_009790 [Eretmocerus hayati]
MFDDYRVEMDQYGCLTIGLPYSNDGSDYGSRSVGNLYGPTFSFVHPSENICNQPQAERVFIMRHLFFTLHCKKFDDGSKKLTINGSTLHDRIGRRLKNWDIPYLLIFLTKNPDVTRLSLPSNEIESPGFINLVDYISERSHFVELDVRYNKIGDPGINALFNKGHQLKLQVLQLGGNKIGIGVLYRLISLQILEQRYVDVRPYRIDDTFHVAYTEVEEGYDD